MSEVLYTKLGKSLDLLEEQYDNFRNMHKTDLNESIKEAIQESVIKRFEICFDSLHKGLRKYLESEGTVFQEENPSPNKIFRTAYENGILNDLEDWIDKPNGYTQARVNTSHDYSEEKAKKCLEKIEQFIEDTKEIYETIISTK